jgi:hypothetical protein
MAGCGTLDSAGMLIAADGSSKQRGHGQDAAKFAAMTEALLPSGSAALYRRKMLDEIGLFDELFFLYCEDTDLGLRARWAGWECGYVPGAIVEHQESSVHHVGSRAADDPGALFLARGPDDSRPRKGGGVSSRWILGVAASFSGDPCARLGAVPHAQADG